MITTELTRKIDLLPGDAYSKVERFVDQLLQLSEQTRKEKAFRLFMEKMDAAEKSILEDGGYSEEEVEAELAKI